MRSNPSNVAMPLFLNHAPANNAAATKTVAAGSEDHWVLLWLHVSFDAAPSAAVTLTVAFGGTTIWSVDIAAAGVYTFDFGNGLWHTNANGKPTDNEAMVVTLPAGGAGVGGTINLGYK